MFFGNHNFYSLLYGYILFNILLLNSICNIATAAICRCVQVVWWVFFQAGGECCGFLFICKQTCTEFSTRVQNVSCYRKFSNSDQSLDLTNLYTKLCLSVCLKFSFVMIWYWEKKKNVHTYTQIKTEVCSDIPNSIFCSEA